MNRKPVSKTVHAYLGEWKHLDSVAPSARHITIPSDPVSNHSTDRVVMGATAKDRTWKYLPVAQQHIGELLSYVITEQGDYLLEDHSGPGTSDRDRDNEVEYVSPTLEWDTLDRWTDKASNGKDEFICTTTLAQHLTGTDEALVKFIKEPDVKDSEGNVIKKGKVRQKVSPVANGEYISDEIRNAYIEGADGFTSRKLLDETLTRKYHARLLNVYLDKHQSVAIGSIRIRRNADGTIYAECVAGYCNLQSPPINPDEVTREQMEDFVLGIVRHGNNHAAKWFRERETFYKVHASACDMTCDPNSANCNNNDPKPNPLTDEEVVEFLFEHQRYCSDSKCACTERLAELVPALTYQEAS